MDSAKYFSFTIVIFLSTANILFRDKFEQALSSYIIRGYICIGQMSDLPMWIILTYRPNVHRSCRVMPRLANKSMFCRYSPQKQRDKNYSPANIDLLFFFNPLSWNCYLNLFFIFDFVMKEVIFIFLVLHLVFSIFHLTHIYGR